MNDMQIMSIVMIIIGGIGFLFWFFPVYGVWSSEKSGQADLAAAHFEQQVQVTQANGRLRAAESNKKAAIVEAEAVAAQIKLIGNELKSESLYLRWQWIKMMEETTNHSTIYVPTEASLPILEAGRFKKDEAEAS